MKEWPQMSIWEENGEPLTAPYTGDMTEAAKPTPKAAETKSETKADTKPETKVEEVKSTEAPLPELDDLDTARWVANHFFEGGRTKKPRLDEIHNFANGNLAGHCDTSDRALAAMILNRAGISEHYKYEDLRELLADALASIDNPTQWLNPDSPYLKG